MVRRKNGELVKVILLYARKGGGCTWTAPPEISINVVSKSCKSCTLTSVTCRIILFYACASCSFSRQLLKRLRTPKVFSFVCTPHAEKKPKCTPKIFGSKCMECRLALPKDGGVSCLGCSSGRSPIQFLTALTGAQLQLFLGGCTFEGLSFHKRA